ncbi:peroxisomal membrane protein PEX16 [Venturia canescens]|uniref:peroxisomal membrane protein PEX16 n=1 Tax=Venturia canescens TaxID=32260 RepID=UPI001C9CBA2E|nr:peroxisomal membrane protein PEX16 [Venturia canescens]
MLKTSMDSVNSTLSPYLKTYKEWILNKPQLIADIESTVRCLSYFTAGRITSSSLVSELIYSLPNLLILLNDRLIYSSKYAHLKLPQFQSQIKVWLTVIEYTEALIEVSAKNVWGERGRWYIIVIIQSLKVMLRLVLVHRNKERITQTPAIPPLNREKLSESCSVEPVKEGFVLKHSGTVVRSVSATPPLHSRVWAPLKRVEGLQKEESLTPAMRKNIILAESLYIIKPLVHLSCMMAKGQRHWLPWSISFLMDITSLRLLNKDTKTVIFTKEEREEICRRRIGLLLYILRSPFYDKCSKEIIFSLLNRVSTSIPLARFVAEPIAKYLPHWQNTYFYMWSS